MTADEAVAQQVANRILYVPTASGTAYHVNTPPAVVTALEYARQKGKRVRLFYGDPQTGRDWAKEYGVVGRVAMANGKPQVTDCRR